MGFGFKFCGADVGLAFGILGFALLVGFLSISLIRFQWDFTLIFVLFCFFVQFSVIGSLWFPKICMFFYE